MALKSLGGEFGFAYPMLRDESAYAMGSGTYLLNTDGTYLVAVVFQAPKTGTIVGADAIIRAVSNAANNGLQIGQMGIAAGFPDLTFVRSVTSAVNTPAAAGLWAPGDWNTSVAVTRGDHLCIAIRNPSFTTGDNVTIGHMLLSADIHFPMGYYGANAAAKSGFSVPMIFPRYSDGSYGFISRETPCASTVTEVTINTGSAFDEIGNAFVPPVPMRSRGCIFNARNMLAAAFDVMFVNAGGSVLASKTVPADYNTTTAANRYFQILWDADVDLQAGATYYLTIKPSSGTDQIVHSYDIYPSVAAMRDTVDGGVHVYMVTRKGGGAWTAYNAASPGYRRTRMSILVSAVENGVVSPRTRALRRP